MTYSHGVRRSELVEVLREGCRDLDIRFSLTLDQLRDSGGEVKATFSDGSTQAFDLNTALGDEGGGP